MSEEPTIKKIIEATYIKEGLEVREPVFDNGAWQDDNGDCWICGKQTKTMLLLSKIDDGCMDEFICSNCIKKISDLIQKEG